nr:hypothetical protein [Stenotrophomonas maltophilia]
MGADDNYAQCQAQRSNDDAHAPGLQDHAQREFIEHARVQAPAQPDACQHLQRGLEAGRQEILGADELVAGQQARAKAGQATAPAAEQAADQQDVETQVELDHTLGVAGHEPGIEQVDQAQRHAHVQAAAFNGMASATGGDQQHADHADHRRGLQQIQRQAGQGAVQDLGRDP